MRTADAMRVGCCGFPVARRKYYATFAAVEIQQTFYQPPRPETAAKWRAEAPAGFEFAIKAWQLITHEPTSPTYRRLKIEIPVTRASRYGSFKPTDEVREAWEVTRRFARELGALLVLFQCPASFTPSAGNKKNMRRFFAAVERGNLTLVWEPRGEWSADEIRGLCEELDLVHCVDPLQRPAVWGRLRYYRLHGPAGYNSRYEPPQLQRLLGMCARKTYVFFNNRYMFEDARAFLRLLRRTAPSRP
ncbi:MAG TPA: DUF72 domain-containing protein [candidate division Zixibacteria bacterium]|nr:DUF72 domain-containing protein [candidate division Zixibacteria bacterium]